MAESIEIRRIKDAIKKVMRKKGHKYEDLASALGLSLTTVKRVLNKEDLTLKRLQQILKWLGLSFSEIAALSEEAGRGVYSKFSEEQERFLAENTDYICILEELMVGKTPKYVQKKYKLNRQSMQRYLLGLDRKNLIELHPSGRVRMLVKGMALQRGGPVTQAVAEKMSLIAKENVELGLLFGDNLPKFCLHFNTNLWIRPKTLEQLQRDLKELIDKYTSIAVTEQAVESTKDLIPAIWFFILHNTDINERIFNKPKNFPDTLTPDELRGLSLA